MDELGRAMESAAGHGRLPLESAAGLRQRAVRRRAHRRYGAVAAVAAVALFGMVELIPAQQPQPAPPVRPAPTDTATATDEDAVIPTPGDVAMLDGFVFPEEDAWSEPQLVDGAISMPQACDGGMNLSDVTPGRTVFFYPPGPEYEQRSVAGFADDAAARLAMDNLRAAAERCDDGSWHDVEVPGVGDDALAVALRGYPNQPRDVLVVRLGSVIWSGWTNPAHDDAAPQVDALRSAWAGTRPRLDEVVRREASGLPRPGDPRRLDGVTLNLEQEPGVTVLDNSPVIHLPCPSLQLDSRTPTRRVWVETGRDRFDAAVQAFRGPEDVAVALEQARAWLGACTGPRTDVEGGGPTYTIAGHEPDLGDGAVAFSTRTIGGTGGGDVLLVGLGDLLYIVQAGSTDTPPDAPFDADGWLAEQLAADASALG